MIPLSRLVPLAMLAACLFGAPPSMAQTPTPPPAGSPVALHGALQVRGTHLLDASGAPVTLRGMSLFWSQWIPKYYNADAIRWLRDDWHADAVRAAMAVDAGGYLTNPEVEQAKVERVIEAAIANGMYVLVDWHAHDPHPAEAARFFGEIARKYGQYPNLIYEVWNEPLPQYGWSKVLKPYHEQVIASIRAHDPDNLVVAGTRSWSQDVDEAAADPIRDPNIAYTLHFYAATHKQELRDKASVAMAKGIAIFVTEWGSTQASGDESMDVAETHRWWTFLEDHGISYMNWSLADKNELAAALKPGADPKGGWSDEMLTPSGRLVREQLRNPRRSW